MSVMLYLMHQANRAAMKIWRSIEPILAFGLLIAWVAWIVAMIILPRLIEEFP